MTQLSIAEAPARNAADGIALIHGAQRWTWAQLQARAEQWRGWLQEQGVHHDDLVAFAMPNGPEFFALTFGIYRAGATPAPLSPKLPVRERDEILALMKPAAFVTGDMADRLSPCDPAPTAAHVAKSWKACTSGGSTGRPKVIIDGRTAAFPEGMDFIAIPTQGRVLVPGPLYHNAPFSAAVFALWKACTVVTMDRFDAEDALRLISDERLSWAMMVPTMMHRIWRLPGPVRHRFDLTCWKAVVHTAAPMAPWLKRAWIDWLGPDHVWEVYGATEGFLRCWIGGREWLERPGSVGRATGGFSLRILDSNGNELPAGEIGEVYAMPPNGPGTTYRYIGAGKRATHDGWETVGDIGHLDADGYLYLADRRVDLIISGGVNIWPAEVEAALLRHPSIRSCAVVGSPDDDRGECVHAIVETDDAALSLEVLRTFLAPYLSAEKHPRLLTLSAGPVRDDAGKVRKSSYKGLQLKSTCDVQR